MTTEESPPESDRRRMVWIGLIFLASLGGVTVVGLFFGGGKIGNTSADADRPADATDEEWADMVAYRNLPEKAEIERLQGEFIRRGRQKQSPMMEPVAFARLMDLTRHPNLVVRCQSTFILGSFGFGAIREPHASDPVAVDQMTKVHEYLIGCISDPSSHIRGWAYRILGHQHDDRFIEQARGALKSPSKAERDGAEYYLVALAKRKPAGK